MYMTRAEMKSGLKNQQWTSQHKSLRYSIDADPENTIGSAFICNKLLMLKCKWLEPGQIVVSKITSSLPTRESIECSGQGRREVVLFLQHTEEYGDVL